MIDVTGRNASASHYPREHVLRKGALGARRVPVRRQTFEQFHCSAGTPAFRRSLLAWPFRRSFTKPRVARTLTRCARAAQPRTLRVSLVCPTALCSHLHLPETRGVTILADLFAPRTGWRTRRREACHSSTTVERARQVLATEGAQRAGDRPLALSLAATG